MRNTAVLVLGISVLFAAPASTATSLRLYSTSLDMDPNSSLWRLSAKICNKDQSQSGALLYELRLYKGDMKDGAQFIKIGGVKYAIGLRPGKCYSRRDMPVKVSTLNVPAGKYKVVLWIGDYKGHAFSGRSVHTFDRAFIRSNDP